MIGAGGDANLKDTFGGSALLEAVGARRRDLVDLLVSNGAELGWDENKTAGELCSAVAESDVALLELYIAGNARTDSGRIIFFFEVEVDVDENENEKTHFFLSLSLSKTLFFFFHSPKNTNNQATTTGAAPCTSPPPTASSTSSRCSSRRGRPTRASETAGGRRRCSRRSRPSTRRWSRTWCLSPAEGARSWACRKATSPGFCARPFSRATSRC